MIQLFLFKYDTHNPYRRYCKKCGQQQDAHCHTWNWARHWWEDMNQIIKESCVCHKYSEYN